MDNAHIDLVWEDFPSDKSPVDAQNLNTMVNSMNIVNKNTNTMDTTKFDTAEAQLLVNDVRLDEKSGVLTVIHYNGATTTYSSLLSKIAVNFDFDETTQKIILFLPDGEQKEIDLSAFIADYEFIDTETINFRVEQDGTVSAIVKEGSIKEKHLSSDYLVKIKEATDNAQVNAKMAESFTHGNTGIRPGEDSDNAAYYSNQAKEYSNSCKGSLLPKGTIPFSSLPSFGNVSGHMYNINQSFVTDTRFKDGAGYSYPAGTNVYWTSDEKWDCLSGTLTMEITQAEYDALSQEEKMNGTIYYISDSDDSIPEGGDGVAGLVVVDSELSSTSKNPVQNRGIPSGLAGKVDKISGKELSSNDYTDDEKDKLTGIAAGAEVNVQADWKETDPTSDAYIKNKPLGMGEAAVDSSLSPTSTNAVQNRVVYEALEEKLDIMGTAKKAESLSNTSAVGSATQPVYFNDKGKPEVCTGMANYRKLTQAEYDALTSVQKMNGTISFIEDSD